MQTPDPELIAKHFKEVPNLTIQPGKVETPAALSANKLKSFIETYFSTTKATYFNTYQNGKLLAMAKEYKSPIDVLPVLSSLIIQGIKNGNINAGISNETLSQYFSGLALMFQLLETNMKNVIGQEGKHLPEQSQPGFDAMELMAILCGFLVAKLND